MGALDLSSSVCVFFDLDVGGRGQPMYDHASALVVQFQTRYRIPDGQERLRVQTVARTWVAATATEIRQGFDQEAAAVAIARCARVAALRTSFASPCKCHRQHTVRVRVICFPSGRYRATF